MIASDDKETLKRLAAEAAVDYVHDGQIVGLGTGSTARYVVLALAERVKAGLAIKGVPTSRETAALASSHGITLLDSDGPWQIDVAIDGADEVDPQLNLIKGGGGALLREKIVAAAARQVVIVVDQSKRVPVLGQTFPLPIEVVAFGWRNTVRQVEQAVGSGSRAVIRQREGQPVKTESGHFILDLHSPGILKPAEMEARLNLIPGVVENGLFVGRTHVLLVGTSKGIEVQRAPGR
jgi:ribose 5-phosphate isomerase A